MPVCQDRNVVAFERVLHHIVHVLVEDVLRCDVRTKDSIKVKLVLFARMPVLDSVLVWDEPLSTFILHQLLLALSNRLEPH